VPEQHFSDLERTGITFFYQERYGKRLRIADVARFERGETSKKLTHEILEVLHEQGLTYRLRGYYFGRGFGPCRLGEPVA